VASNSARIQLSGMNPDCDLRIGTESARVELPTMLGSVRCFQTLLAVQTSPLEAMILSC
jgi:hypothetical protein